MKTRAKAVAAFLGCCSFWGLACSQSSGPSTANGGSGGGSGGVASGGSGSGSGGAASGGNGGSSSSSQGGSSTGGTASGGVGAGGAGEGGSRAGGAGGSKPSGTGGSSGGATTSAEGGRGTGGSTGKGTGGATRNGGSGGGTVVNGTGGAAAATGGSTGAGGSTSSEVVPTTVSGRNRFAWDDVIFEVDPKVGARVAKLSLGGTDMMPTPATDNTTWGGVFWTSPQSAWDSFWPPPKAIDSDAYTGGISGSHLKLDSGSYAALGVSVSKDFSADSSTGWITIVYTIKASKALSAAPWENCRVLRGGLAFFPAGSSLSKGPLTMTEAGGIVWFDDASKSASSPDGKKAIADGSGGWMAYALGGNLLLRKFKDTEASAQAKDEGEDEIYPGEGFLELEVQGAYTSIPAGGSLSWTVSWRIVKIPSSVTVSAGSTTLADFAKQQAAL